MELLNTLYNLMGLVFVLGTICSMGLSLTMAVRPARIGSPNWLPAPDGPFALSLRIYWPGQDVLDGKWEPSAIKKT